MISKTVKMFKRRRGEGLYPSSVDKAFTETVKRETWWLFWIIPLYSREEILSSNL